MTEGGTLALAQHYLEIEQPARALSTLDSGQVDPFDTEFWRLRAAALHDLDREDEACAAAASGLEIDPDDIGLLAVHGLAKAQLGDLAAAERSLLAALRLDPENVWLLAEYALLAARAGQIEKAHRLLAEGARVDPTSSTVASARAVLAYLEADDPAAAAHAESILAHDPEARGANLIRGAALAEQGRSREARRNFELVARADPADHEIVELARRSRYTTHPVLLPLVPIARFGRGGVWIAGVAFLGLARLSGSGAFMLAAVLIWLGYVAYTWVAPPLLRAWLNRKGR